MEQVARTPQQLGSLLKSHRNQRALTQQAAGTKVGLKQSTVSTMEANAARTTVESLYKLLSALDLELVIREKQGPKPRSTKREW